LAIEYGHDFPSSICYDKVYKIYYSKIFLAYLLSLGILGGGHDGGPPICMNVVVLFIVIGLGDPSVM
jgi:hypothetical protein